jgi:hypothetical protein
MAPRTQRAAIAAALLLLIAVPASSVAAASPVASTPVPSAASPEPSPASPGPSQASPSASSMTDPTTVRPEEPWIAYEWVTPEANKANGVGIRLIRPDGSGDHWAAPDAPIGGGTDNGQGWQVVPDWSADGQQLAFAVDNAATEIGTRDIWVGDASGANERLVYQCAPPCLAAIDPSWTHDGSSLIFVAWDHINHAVDGSRLELLDLTDGSVRTLATTTGSDYFRFPRFSRDGARVVAEIDHWSSTDDSSVFVSSWIAIVDLTASPTTITPITDPALFANYPDWNPTQDLIVFTTSSSDVDGTGDLYTTRPDGTEQRLLLHDTRHLWEPSWLPDGSGVIFVTTPGSYFTDPTMWTVAADGTGFMPATADGPHFGSHPRIRPLPGNNR